MGLAQVHLMATVALKRPLKKWILLLNIPGDSNVSLLWNNYLTENSKAILTIVELL